MSESSSPSATSHLTAAQIEAVFVTTSPSYPDCYVIDKDDFAQIKALAISVVSEIAPICAAEGCQLGGIERAEPPADAPGSLDMRDGFGMCADPESARSATPCSTDAKDAARYRLMRDRDMTAEYSEYHTATLNGRSVYPLDLTIDAEMERL